MIENPSGAINGDAADAQSSFGDPGLAHHLFADGEGALKERVERRADGVDGPGGAVGFPDLAENLRLTDHHRVERRCDGEEVLDDVALGLLVEVRADV